MRRLWIVIPILFHSFAAAQQAPPEIPFESVPNALKLPPDMNLGEAAGVAVNSWRVQKLVLHPNTAAAASRQ
ncbi:MAG TPA: hypothetical protein VMV60_07060 [Thermoanaerobaculia bacterium]|nr:hypothetical protein [Thermoanaerobaculia bacterium]